MHQQEESKASQAQQISISVKGESTGEIPLEFLLTLQASSVHVSRVEMPDEAESTLRLKLNSWAKAAREIKCRKRGTRSIKATASSSDLPHKWDVLHLQP